jgi:WD40 repeat protein
MRSLCLIAIALLVACVPAPALNGAAPLPTESGMPSQSAVATAGPPAYRDVMPLGDGPAMSPDGQTVVSIVQGPKGVPPAYVFQRLDGTVIWQRDNVTGWPEWLPDSSGVFIPLAAMQRAGPLGVLWVDGTLAETGLDDANPALSPDGKWIAAERQEGCCVGIGIHEIRIAPRAGSPARTLATSTDPTLQPVSLLGWSPDGAVLYRDGAHIRRVTLDGRITELTGAPIGRPDLTRSAVSPDGRVILGCAADPLAFWVISGGTVADLGAQPAWPLRVPWCSRPDEVIWLGGHELPVRDASGQLRAFDAATGTSRALTLPGGATLVSASGDAVLLSIDGELHVVSASTGLDRVVGLRAGPGASARPVAGGRFFLVDGHSGYLIG